MIRPARGLIRGLTGTKGSAVKVKTKRGSAQRLASTLITLLFIFGVSGIIAVSSAPPAAAVSSSAITPEYWWPHNGCNVVTDSPMADVSFTYACNHHDGCYALRWSSDRATCDLWFLNDMKNACSRSPWWQYGACVASAKTYYWFVRTFGQYWWDRAIATERINTRMG